MNILTLTNLYPPDFIGGYEILCNQVVEPLRARGHFVQVLTSAPRAPIPTSPHVDRSLQLSELFDVSPPRGGLRLTLAEVRSKFINAFNVHRLLTVLESFRPDVAYLHNLEGIGGLGLLACLNHLQVPWVWQLGDAVPRTLCSLLQPPRPPRPQDTSTLALVRECNRQLRGHYIACSRRLLVDIQAKGLRLNGPCELLPYWVHDDLPPARSNYLRNGHLRIVAAGQLLTRKGTNLIIEASARLHNMGHHNFTVDLFGKNSDPRWQCLIDKSGLRGCVTLRGLCPPSQLAAHLTQYDVFAFPTDSREPFGVAPLEAAAQGCVPIMSKCCGIAEWLMNNVHCLKAKRTPAAFAQILSDILEAKIDITSLGRRCAAVTRRDFHLKSLLPRIETILNRAANRPRETPRDAAQVYHLALLAERTAHALVQELLAS